MSDYSYLDKGNDSGTILGKSSSTKLGFYGIAPVDQPDALTTALTTITFTTATTYITTISVAITAGVGFSTTGEAQTFLQVVKNLQVRIAEIQSRLTEVGLVAGGTAITTATEYDYVGAGNNSDGMILGQDSSEKIGLYGITPCDQPAALTAQSGTIVVTATASVLDYTIAALVSNSAGFGWVDHSSGASLFQVVANLQTRVGQIETNLAEVGLIAGGTAIDSTTATTYDYLDKGNDGGTVCGIATSSKIAFWGTTPVDQPAVLTTAATTISCTAPVSTTSYDYAFADLVSTIATFKFVTATAATTLSYVVQNMQTRCAELEARLEELGLCAAN